MFNHACHHAAYLQHEGDLIIRTFAGAVNVLLPLSERPRVRLTAAGVRRNLCSCVHGYAEEITQMMFSDSVQEAGWA